MQKKSDSVQVKANINLVKRLNKQFFTAFFKKKAYIRKKKFTARLVFFFERYNLNFKRKVGLFNSLLILRIKQNNFFITLLNLKTNKVCKIWSCGLYALNASKRTLKVIVNLLLIHIFKFLKRKLRNANFIIIIRGMTFIKKRVLRKIKLFFKKRMYLLVSKSSKIFNGCRAKKIRRKKYKKFRFLK